MFLYLKALHIIFVVTWFAGLFYIVRLLIYHREAQDMDATPKEILSRQYKLMSHRLWYIITWPSAILTLILGPVVMYTGGYLTDFGQYTWLHIKIALVGILYLYHFSIHYLVNAQKKDLFRYSSNQLRMWNEVPTILLFSIVFLASVKQSMSWLYGTLGIFALIALLTAFIRIYRRIREKG